MIRIMNENLQVLIGALNKIPHAAFAMQGLIPTMRLPAVKETVQKVLTNIRGKPLDSYLQVG